MVLSSPSIAQRSPGTGTVASMPAEDALPEDLLEFQMAVRNPQEGRKVGSLEDLEALVLGPPKGCSPGFSW